jgi:hypothetical protein
MVKYTKITLAWWIFFPVLRLCKKWREKYTDLQALPNYAETQENWYVSTGNQNISSTNL